MNLPVKAGDIVGGKYTIEALLGAGGMGAVFLASHAQLRRHVAIKFLLSEAMSNPDAFARFEREAHAAAALQSDHVTRVLDMGALPSGTPYIVMEYLEGEDLAARLVAQRQLPVEQAVAYILEACDALSEAHALGIVHRDLKPANLFLAHRPNGATRVKVLDFGISKMRIEGKPLSLTGTGAIMGSPLYMSPEQLRGSGKVDERSDIWALGVVLYELLAGDPPFMAEAFPEQCALILTAPVPALLAKRAGVPARLEAVILRCLAKPPSERFSTVGELAAALFAAVPNLPLGPTSGLVSSRPPPNFLSADATERMPAIPERPTGGNRYGNVTAIPVSNSEGPPVHSRRALGVGVALAACALGAVLGAGFVLRPHSQLGLVTSPAAPIAAPVPSASAGEADPPRPPALPLIPPPPPLPSPPPPAEPALTAATPSPPATPTHHAAPSTPAPRPKSHAAAPIATTTSAAPAAAPPAPPPAAAPAAADCSTPYFFDAQGNKVFKPECLK